MATPHIHAEVIKAWADGAVIQFRNDRADDSWYNLGSYPNWHPSVEYRVKPETIRYRVAMINGRVTTTSRMDVARAIEKAPHFNRWLTDWIEVEV